MAKRKREDFTNQQPCQCEHVSHFWDGDNELATRVHSPNGNPNHGYGTPYYNSYIVTIKTTGGTFNVCKDCAKDCMAEVTING